MKILALFLCFSSAIFANWQEELRQKVQENNPPAWMLEQIHEDLAPFHAIAEEDLKKTLKENNHRNRLMLVRFAISNNKVIVKTNDSANSHPRFFDLLKAFELLASTLTLPNVDFIVSLHDCLTRDNRSGFKAPVLCFAKDKSLDPEILLMPDFEALLGNNNYLTEVAKGIEAYPWENKQPIAIWRGGTTGGDESTDYTLKNFLTHPRSELVTLSLKFPLLIDARFNLLGQSPEPKKIMRIYASYFGNSISVSEHLKNKYQILIDGNSCAYSRAFWQLFSNCVIFKQDSDHIQWYYRALQPDVHYIPVKHHVEDLIEKISWAQGHDKECFEISKNANDFAHRNLKQSDVMFYFYLLLCEYAKLQNH